MISNNFFKFDVNKDINVLTPDENDNKNRTIDLCFSNYEIVQNRLFKSLAYLYMKRSNFSIPKDKQDRSNMVNIMSLKDRFDITVYAKNIIQPVVTESPMIEEFIFHFRYCYRVRIKSKLIMRTNALNNVSSYLMSMSQHNTTFDPRRLIPIKLTNPSTSLAYRINSYSVSLDKLEWPYSDKCVDYPKHGLINSYDAMTKCDEQVSPHLSPYRIVWKKFYRNSSHSIARARCNIRDFPVPCKQRLYLTQIRVPDIAKGKESSNCILY